jgi:adenylate kinase
MDRGQFVPDDITLEMVKQKIKGMKNCIFDGFPRNLEQAKALDKMTKIDMVINLVARQPLIISRATGRRVCQKCKTIFHLKMIPPKKPGICDYCGSKLIQRDDDKEEVIKERLKIYEQQTAPLVDYYKKKGILKEIDANPEVDKIFESVKKLFEN